MITDILKSAEGEEWFPSLSEAERRMLTAVNGEAAVCGNSPNDLDELNNPHNAESWGRERTIRSSVIHWLCTQADALGRNSNSGIYVYAARISGVLNLSYTVIPCPLIFERCAFMDEISLKNARVPSLILTGSWTRTILADGIDVGNNVLLNGGFYSKGQVLLRDAKIGGNLRTENAKFEYEPGGQFGRYSENSLGCDRAKVNGSIFLSKPGQGSSFKGEVGLAGAFVGSNLECDSSTFEGLVTLENPRPVAIRADRISVVGSVFLRKHFASNGAVRFLNARMDVLDCTEGTFVGDGDTALSAEAATISGYAVFEGSVIKCGATQLRGVTAGDVTFRGAELMSVDLRYATIRRALRLKRITNPQYSHWDLRNSSVGSIDDDRGSWPNPENLLLDGLTYERFGSVTSSSQDDFATCPTDYRSRLHWLKLDTSNPPHAYKQLASVYSKLGDTLNSRATLYSLESLLHRRRVEEEERLILKGAQWVWSEWLKITIGYGYKLWRSLYWLVPLCVLGGIVSYFGYYNKVIVPTDKDAYMWSVQHGYVPNNYPRFSATMFTIEHSLPAINLGVASSWSADATPQNMVYPLFANGIRIWLCVQRLLGWLLSIFFVAGITGLVKSDR
jgi:hypothetical protein